MFLDELTLTIEEMCIVRGGTGDPDGEGKTGSGNGEEE